MRIVRAEPADADILTAIAFAAKRHRGYPESWIQQWSSLLTINAGFITNHETHKAVADNSTIGFYAFTNGSHSGAASLEHLWVLPSNLRRGIGRSLFAHAVGRAVALGYDLFEIESDPYAEGFYLRMGAARVGTDVTMVDGSRRELPVLAYALDGACALRRGPSDSIGQ